MSARAWTVEVPANQSVMIAPDTNIDVSKLDPWSSETIDPGQYVLSEDWDDGGYEVYWSPNGGTSTESPTHSYGAKTYSDGVTWVVIPAGRSNVTISADLDNPVSVGLSYDLEGGVILDDARPGFTFEGMLGAVFAKSNGTTATLSVNED